MPAKDESFIRQARRAQLVEVAVGSIADDGATGTSVSAIARRAGVSRGVVTYHFADGDELLREVIAHVYDLGRDSVAPHLAAARSGLESVTGFVRGSVALYAAHPREMRALHVLYAVDRLADRAAQPEHQQELVDLEAHLRRGAADGSVREVDAPLAVAVVRGALDHAYARVAGGDDPAGVAEVVVRMVEDLLAPR